MILKKTLIVASLLMSLLACQTTSESNNSSEKSTLTLIFNGKTKTYNDASISVGNLGSIESIGIAAGSDGSDYLSLTAYGSQAGTYPYKPNE